MERGWLLPGRAWGARAALLGIVALALLLRMGWPTLAEFKRDEATVVRRALAIAYEGDLPATGADSSRGMALLPLTLYLMAIPLRLWRDPLATVLFTGLLNGLAVWACYGLGRAYFGRSVGLLAAFLFAVSPWAVVYGRKIWSQNLPLVTLGFFAALLATFVRGKPWALVGAFVGLAALVGLHLGGLAFIPILAIAVLLYRKQVARWPFLVGLALFLLALSPYVVHDALHGWSNLRGFTRYAGGEGRFSADALRYAFVLTGSAGIHGLAGGLYPEYLAGLPNLWGLNYLMMGLFALALLYALVQVVRGPQERRRPLLLLLLWFAVPVALQSRPTAPVQPFYFILLYPVQFLLIAVLLVDVLVWLSTLRLRRHSLWPRWRGVAGRSHSSYSFLIYSFSSLAVALLGWGGWQVAVIGRLLLFTDRYPTTGGYGIPLKYTRAAAQEALRLASPSEVVVLSAGVNPATDETPAVFEALLFGHPHRFTDGRLALPVPDAPETVYLAGPVAEVIADCGFGTTRENASDLAPVLERLAGLGNVRPGPVVRLPDGWAYRLFYRSGPDREDVLAELTRFPEALRFANGTAFLGYQVDQAVPDVPIRVGSALEVWLAWWVASPPPPGVSYHFFAHLLDEEGRLRSQHDGAGFPTSSWRAGDLVLSRFSVPIPEDLSPGRYAVWAGLYSYPDVVNVPVLDVAGNPAADMVALGDVAVAR
ncbi:MAG TPA: glycosyltransferase family 39 protein [Anaerolineae bacterium]|nr:glycosyltransferase family 39 protein [Anaerolineae bacterium]